MRVSPYYGQKVPLNISVTPILSNGRGKGKKLLEVSRRNKNEELGDDKKWRKSLYLNQFESSLYEAHIQL